jgi:hypothetical protein
MKKAAFTIVAKNYFSFAITLADSIQAQDPALPFYILLVDDKEGLNEEYFSRYNIINASEINIPDFSQLSFKYNVTEFSTAVKPFFIDYLFNIKKYDKAIYFDPDIYLYTSADTIFNELDNYAVIITPHILAMEEKYTGNAAENEFLFSGIYNLGFIALRNTVKSNQFIQWWKKRLADYCYGDRMDSLHVDQKWIDFIPAFFTPDELLISKHLGYNIAYWNIHERNLAINNDTVSVSFSLDPAIQYPLVFLHFSGLNPLNIMSNKQCPAIDIDKYPAWKKLIEGYAEKVIANNYSSLLKLRYSFNYFLDKKPVLPLHRRMYRKLLTMQQAQHFADPFSIDEDSYYNLLLKNKLILADNNIESMVTDSNIKKSSNKLKYINKLLVLLKSFIGLKQYIILLRFFQKYVRPENQLFLISEYKKIAEEKYFNKIQ